MIEFLYFNEFTYLRLINGNDLSSYFNLLKQLTSNFEIIKDSTKFQNKIKKMQMKDQYIYMLCIYDEEEIILGTGKIIIEEKMGKSVGHIEDIIIDEKYRKQNHGITLVQLLTNKIAFEHFECYKVLLSCSPDKEGFYKKCQFDTNKLKQCVKYY